LLLDAGRADATTLKETAEFGNSASKLGRAPPAI